MGCRAVGFRCMGLRVSSCDGVNGWERSCTDLTFTVSGSGIHGGLCLGQCPAILLPLVPKQNFKWDTDSMRINDAITICDLYSTRAMMTS